MRLNSIPEIFGEGQWRHYYFLNFWHAEHEKNKMIKRLIFICKIVFYKCKSSSAVNKMGLARDGSGSIEQQCLQYDYIVITVICCYDQSAASLSLKWRFQTFLHSPQNTSEKNIYSEIGARQKSLTAPYWWFSAITHLLCTRTRA